jgi:pyridoxine 5-phosphate synthase
MVVSDPTPITTMLRPRLGVNVDHVATVREARGTDYPDPVHAAVLAERAGADQITVHLRLDRRHIHERDVRTLRETTETRLNLEMAATDEMREIAAAIGPDMVTVVPERREEQTTEGGLDVTGQRDRLSAFVDELESSGAHVSFFIDPDSEQIRVSRELGAEIVELHTGDYCEASARFRNRADASQ